MQTAQIALFVLVLFLLLVLDQSFHGRLAFWKYHHLFVRHYTSQNRNLLAGAGLYLLTLLAFLGVAHNGFINYDDPDYVTRNPHVLTGLSWANLRWAFTSSGAFYWHPLTWLSHMLDVQLFGLNPHWHHLVSLHLHFLNALVLFLILQSMTAAPGRSFFVAALFAVHPLRVESVAWIAERKDLLSTLFCLLTIWAYAKYAALSRVNQPPSARASLACYVAALILFLLGLMCKPMLVTLPFALLLLDFWPLGRFHHGGAKLLLSPDSDVEAGPPPGQAAASAADLPTIQPLDFPTDSGRPQMTKGSSYPGPLSFLSSAVALNLRGLLLEKLPFAALAAASCLVTILATSKTNAIVRGLPFGLRAANAIASYFLYLAQTVWPANLAIFYPHPDTRYFAPQSPLFYPASEQWADWQILAAGLCLVCVSVLVVLRRRTEPWLFTGWFWYLLTLVPVIGLVQVGMQGRADRFTYLPLIGIFVAITWLAAEIRNPKAEGRKKSEGRNPNSKLIGGARLLPSPNPSSLAASEAQKSGLGGSLAPPEISAFGLAAGTLILAACVLSTRHQVSFWRDDRTLFEHARAVTSRNPVAEWMVGATLAGQGQLGLAQTHFRLALAADPYLAEAHSALGSLFELEGRPQLATNQYQFTLRIKPGDDFARVHLAGLLQKLGQPDQALAQYEQAVRWNPDSVEANYQAGALLLDAGQLRRAQGFLEMALQLQPNHADALLCLSDLRAQEGRMAEALDALERVVGLYPTNFELRVNLGSMLWKAGQREPALLQYRQAMALNPAQPIIHYDLGVALLAQGKLPDAVSELREALRLKPDYPQAASDLGRALMQQGQFKEAQSVFQHALDLAPQDADLEVHLADALLGCGQTNQANAAFVRAAQLRPDLAERYVAEGRSLMAQGELDAALFRFNNALWLKPNSASVLSSLAWLLATHPQPQARNGPRALALAQQAVALSGNDPGCWAALDVASAENGQFDEALRAALKSRDLALTAGDSALAQAAETRLALYREHRPYHLGTQTKALSIEH